MDQENRRALAERARYVGSPHHTDIPKFGLPGSPREGAVTADYAEQEKIKNPTCTVCPRKWARHPDRVTAVLKDAIEAGNFVAAAEGAMPNKVWARDPDDADLIYEAKLCAPPDGYKGYPLTKFQSRFNLPIELP